MHVLFPSVLLLPVAVTGAGRVPAGELANFLKVIAASVGAPGRVACRDMDLSIQLKKGGLSPDAKSPVAWAANEDQLKAYLGEGKLVVTGDREMLRAGAGIAVIRENGKPVILVHSRNVAASGITLTDALLKIARVL